MKSLLRSIIERAHNYNCTTREKADAIQWHSRNEPNAKWRSIMAKYRSPLSEAIMAQRRDEAEIVGDDGERLDRSAQSGSHEIVALVSEDERSQRGRRSARPRGGSLIDQLYFSMIEIGQYGKKAIKEVDAGLAITISNIACRMRLASRRSGIASASRLHTPSLRSALLSSSTPPFED
jgi:hypothetical protein